MGTVKCWCRYFCLFDKNSIWFR